MTTIILLVFVLFICSMRFMEPKKFNEDYLSIRECNVVKGLFILFVFFRHSYSYMPYQPEHDSLFIQISTFLGPLIVVMFLFYSGYGIMESIKKKGSFYIKTFFRNRFLTVWSTFAIVTIIFIIEKLLLGALTFEDFTIQRILGSFISWRSLGYDSWYMFAIFVLYGLTFIAFLPILKSNTQKVRIVSASVLTVFVIALILIFIYGGLKPWYYNSIIAFPFGFWLSIIKDKAEEIFHKTPFLYWCALSALILTWVAFAAYYPTGHTFNVFIKPILFANILVLLTMKVELRSPLFEYLGKHLFSLFILQRISMMAFQKTAVVNNHYMFLFACFTTTLLLSFILEHFTDKLKKIIVVKPEAIEKK